MVGNARFATTEAVKNAFESAQKNCRYCELLNSDGTLNYFKVDKRVESELMESAYHSPKKLAEAYSSVPNFKVQHENEVCLVGDKERLKRNDLNTPKETRRIEMMNNLDLLDDTSWGISKEILEEITLEDPLLVEAYNKLGREVVEKKCQCVDSLIREQLMLIDYQKKKTGVETIKLVKNAFEENRWYSSKDLKAGLARIFRELDIAMPGGHTPTAETICEFFDAKPHRTAKAQGYDLYACKY